MTLQLSPEAMERLKSAAKRNVSAEPDVVNDLIIEHLPSVGRTVNNDSTLALLEEWRKEDAQMTEEEILREREFWKEFEESINEERRAAGLREL